MLRAVLNVDVTEAMESLPSTFTLKKGTVVEVLQTFGELIDDAKDSYILEDENKYCECRFLEKIIYIAQQDLTFFSSIDLERLIN
jgi:hypothetical protein